MISQEPQTRPDDFEFSEFRQIGCEGTDAIADYQAGISRRSVIPNVTPEEVAAPFIDELAEKGELVGVSAFPFHLPFTINSRHVFEHTATLY
jgi:hypothetical protein